MPKGLGGASFHFILDSYSELFFTKNRILKIRRGKTELEVVELVSDIRKMMRPYTAVRLKEDAKNRKMKLNDYATKLSSALGVSHLIAFSQNESRIYTRIARCPTGPTLTFQIQQFSLTKHVVASQKRPYYTPSLYDHPPLVVSNNFGDATAAPHIKLMRITFQALFPAINVATLNLTDCKRVVLFNLIRRPKKNSSSYTNTDNKIGDVEVSSTNLAGDGEHDEEELVELRHYGIKASPVGVDRKVRRLIQANAPNLGRCQDISEYIFGSKGADASNSSVGSNTAGAMSDSEAEDETSHVVLPQRYLGRGNAKHQKAALKLVELGPRLCLKLVKIERGLASGDVMYHAFQNKTPEEVNAQRMKVEQASQLKKQRREQQEANVARKKQLREASMAKKKGKNHDGTAPSVQQDENVTFMNGGEVSVDSENGTDEHDNYSDYSDA